MDFRKLNACTDWGAYPLPWLEESFMTLGQAKYSYSSSPSERLRSRLHHILGLFMAFGLSNAPSTFWCLMGRCLEDFNFQTVLVYLRYHNFLQDL